jgi:protein SCO1
MRSFIATVAVGAAGLYASWALTDGWQAFTSETARRLAVEHTPRLLPDVALESHRAQPLAFADLRGQVVVADFVYTSCATVCVSLGATFRELAQLLAPEIEREDVVLLSLSLDRGRDTPDALQRYLTRYGAGASWLAARPVAQADADQLQRAFGVVAIPDGLGDIVHNAALYVIDANGRLRGIRGIEEWPRVVEDARGLAAKQDVAHR